MHCTACGCVLQSAEKFCPGCGRPVVPGAPPPAAASPAPMYVHAGEPSGMATASLICGIFFFIVPLAIVAIVLGHVALSQIKKSSGRLIGEGRAIAGLVLGYLGLLVIPFTLILAAILIPNLLRAHIAANEASAVGSVRSIVQAQVAYASLHPGTGYTCNFSELESASLIDHQLAIGRKSGYRFELTGCTSDRDRAAAFQVVAIPEKAGTSGIRSFCSNQTGIIKHARAGEDCLEAGTPIR